VKSDTSIEIPEAATNSAAADPAFADMRYRDLFWPSRRYEDQCDRIALRALLPPTGGSVVELGAGFGRLANEYTGYEKSVLLDLSGVQLDAARERLRDDPRYDVVEGDIFHLPFPDASFDAVVCIRVIHHFQDPRPAIAEMARVLRPGGTLVLEAANKRNLKAIALYLLHRQRVSPFGRGSVAASNATFLPRSASAGQAGDAGHWQATTDFDHTPADIRTWLEAAGLEPRATRTVSNFRLPLLARHLPVSLLVALERVAQPVLAPLTPGPSIFFKAVRKRA